MQPWQTDRVTASEPGEAAGAQFVDEALKSVPILTQGHKLCVTDKVASTGSRKERPLQGCWAYYQ